MGFDNKYGFMETWYTNLYSTYQTQQAQEIIRKHFEEKDEIN